MLAAEQQIRKGGGEVEKKTYLLGMAWMNIRNTEGIINIWRVELRVALEKRGGVECAVVSLGEFDDEGSSEEAAGSSSSS